MSERREDGLARHPLPQSTLKVPLFAGVEAPVFGLEVMVLVAAFLLAPRLWVVLLVGGKLAFLHFALASATAKDRRLTQAFGRSVRYPRYARPWATSATVAREPEPTFPARLLS